MFFFDLLQHLVLRGGVLYGVACCRQLLFEKTLSVRSRLPLLAFSQLPSLRRTSAFHRIGAAYYTALSFAVNPFSETFSCKDFAFPFSSFDSLFPLGNPAIDRRVGRAHYRDLSSSVNT
ncbi:MAG TPA: hypothetical protein EYP34_15065 [Chromatiaceae bacterium]|nr:hypothetical protein [Chromatiaceae bacterium]